MGSEFSRRQFLVLGTAAGLAHAIAWRSTMASEEGGSADLILRNGNFSTMDRARPLAAAVAIRNGRFSAVGSEQEVLRQQGQRTRTVDVKSATVIPGLNDSHTHPIRGGLTYNLELRWEGVPSLADALRLLRDQARRTPAPHWVRVVGGWTEFQFAERRMPTLDELNAVSPDTPVFVLHLYDRALLNRAALRAVGYDKDTPEPPGAEIQRDKQGNPTGLIIARPNASILYATLEKGPRLSREDQVNSTRRFFRELNRLGVTSVVDAGGGAQRYPEDYAVIEELARSGQLTARVAYNLFPQKPKEELADFTRWAGMIKPGTGDEFYRLNGGGEMLVYTGADYEDFRQPRPDLPSAMEAELAAVVTHLGKAGWPFRLHATYDESIGRFLNVLEQVDRKVPLPRWILDHAETISPRNIERVRTLGGGIAIQHRMAFQGEYFIERYGARAAETTPPIARMLQMGVPVGAGTDATRVASYNPFVSLYWLVTGKTLGGTTMYPASNRLDRTEALRLWTSGSAWFSGDEKTKGRIAPGQFADLAVLSGDYFSVPEERIKSLESVLTIVAGKVVHAAGEFASLAPPLPRASPDWSPVAGSVASQGEVPNRGTSGRTAQDGHAHGSGPYGCGCSAF